MNYISANRSYWLMFNQIIEFFLLSSYMVFLSKFLNLSYQNAFIIVLPLFIVWLYFFIIEVIREKKLMFIITDDRLIYKKKEIPLCDIKEVFTKKTFFGKLIKYGDIIISADKVYCFKAISDPDRIVSYLKRDDVNEKKA